MPELDFEAPLVALQKRIEELARFPGDPQKEAEARRLTAELGEARRRIYAELTPWQKTMVARHPLRPYTLDYVEALCTEFTEIHGDRRFADDPALVCGLAFYKDMPVAVIGHPGEATGRAPAGMGLSPPVAPAAVSGRLVTGHHPTDFSGAPGAFRMGSQASPCMNASWYSSS